MTDGTRLRRNPEQDSVDRKNLEMLETRIKSIENVFDTDYLADIADLTGAIPLWTTTSGIKASSVQTQGKQSLVSHLNEVSTVTTANDVVTLPTAEVGKKLVIINNGAKTLQVFPANGGDLGNGTNISALHGAGVNVTYASYNSTNWRPV